MRQPIFELKHRTSYNKMKEKIEWWIAYALPKRIAELAMIRICAHGTTGKYSDTMVNGVTAIEILDRWGQSNVKPLAGFTAFPEDDVQTEKNKKNTTPNLGICSECPSGKIPHPCNENNHEFEIGDSVECITHIGMTGKIVSIGDEHVYIRSSIDRCIYKFALNSSEMKKS